MRPRRILTLTGSRTGRPGERAGLALAAVAAAASAAAALAAAGCGGEGAGDAAPTVRDSAGVAVVENPAGAAEAAPAWSLESEAAFDVGVVEGDSVYQLDDVEGAVRLSGGGVAVADGGSNQIRVYGADGAFRFAAGGQGEGPGEFRRLTALHRLPGDSLLAFDGASGRFSVFAPGGEFVRSERLATEDDGRASLLDRLADGTVVVGELRVFSGGAGTGTNRHPRSYLLRSPDGSLDSLVTLPGSQFHVMTRGDVMAITQLPFTAGPHVTAGEEHVFAGQSDRFDIGTYSTDGTLERRIRLARAPRPVTEDDVNRMLDVRTESLEDPNDARDMRERLRGMELPESMPAFERLAADAAGNLWVREYEPPGTESNRWIVFGPEGAVVATAELPPRFEPLEIGEDYVLGRWSDELDVEHVRLHRLRRAHGGAEGAAADGPGRDE